MDDDDDPSGEAKGCRNMHLRGRVRGLLHPYRNHQFKEVMQRGISTHMPAQRGSPGVTCRERDQRLHLGHDHHITLRRLTASHGHRTAEER